MSNTEIVNVSELARLARAQSAHRSRIMIGIVGEPGAGKSTVAHALTDALSPDAALVPMDGFHLSNHVLESLAVRDRKGAPDTFDAAGFVALLQRIRDQGDEVVYAPAFRRDIEEPIASSIPIRTETPIVITEGNYLLLDQGPWTSISTLLDTTWYLESDRALRTQRLIARHHEFGKTLAQATAWARGSDQHNADIVASTRHRADRVFAIQN